MLAVSSVMTMGGYTAEAAADYSTPYYYNQLSDTGKTIYKELKAAVIECEPTVKLNIGKTMSEEDFNMVGELLVYHDPVTFNLANIGAQWNSRGNVEFDLEYRYSKKNYDKMIAACEKQAEKILAKLTDDMTKYTKIRTIHDAVTSRCEYDVESSNSDNIYGVLVKKAGKCDGYAKTIEYLCAKAGIRAITVIGHSYRDKPDEMHMWNKVYYNKKWYNIDSTWDDPVSNIVSNTTHSFFMVSDDELSATHQEDNQSFEVPDAEDDTISYFEVNKKYAESFDDFKSILKTNLIAKAKKNEKSVEIQCASKSIFNQAQKYLNDAGKVSKLLKEVKKSSGNSSLIDTLYSFNGNDRMYTLKVQILYKNTDIDEYFTDVSMLDDSTIKQLADYGIE